MPRRPTGRPRGRPPHPEPLTPAEQRVFALVREGRSNGEIAASLGVSLSAVKFHVSHLLAKAQLDRREDLAHWAPPPPRTDRMPLTLLGLQTAARALRFAATGQAAAGVIMLTPIAAAVVALVLVLAQGTATPDDAAPNPGARVGATPTTPPPRATATSTPPSPRPSWTETFGALPGPADDLLLAPAEDGSIYAVARVVVRAGLSSKREGDLFVFWRTAAGAAGTNRFHLPGEERPRSAVVAPAGGLFVGGRKTGSADGTAVRGDADGFVARLDKRGGLDWIRVFGSSGDDSVLALTPGPDGSVFAAGTMSAGPKRSPKRTRSFVARLSSAGEVLWRLDSPNGSGWLTTAALSNGSVAVAGWRLTTEGRQHVVALVSPDGALMWERSLSLSSITSIAAAGNILVTTGVDRPWPVVDDSPLGRGYLRAYATDGSLLWQSNLPSSGADRMVSAVAGPGRSTVVVLHAFTALDRRPFSGWDRFGEPPTSGAGPVSPGFAGPLLAQYDAGGSLIGFESLPAWPVTLGPGGSVFTATRDGGDLIVRRLR